MLGDFNTVLSVNDKRAESKKSLRIKNVNK
jgi:hypothetical protein